jgi:hypothetical protein
MKNYTKEILLLNTEDDSVPSDMQGATFGDRPAEDDSVPSKSDIRKELQNSNLEERAIILLMSSSGMGKEEISSLTVKDFCSAALWGEDVEKSDMIKIAENLEYLEYYYHKNIIGTWFLKKQKTGNEYYTFSTNESVKAILDYLIQRQPKNGLINGEEVLFENFGIKKSEKSLHFKAHSLQKYFVSKLQENGLSPYEINWFLGNQAEWENDLFLMREEYLEAVEDLSIEKFKLQTIPQEYYYDLKYELQNEKCKTKKFEDIIDELYELNDIIANEKLTKILGNLEEIIDGSYYL